MLADLLARRLVFVTGKGGVGKTAVTLGLAIAAARERRRVLVVEISPYGRVGEYLGGVTLGPEPTEVVEGVSAACIVPEVVLEDFAVRILRLRALARRLLASQTFRIVAAAAPGIEDFLTLDRVARWEAARTGLRQRRARFDLVLVDAPATGHSVPLLSTPGTLLKMLPFGPLARSARELALLLSDPEKTATAIVTRAEEMAVNETLELATVLMRLGMPLLPPIVNAVSPLRFTRAESRRLLADPPHLPASLRRHVAAGRFSAARQRTAEREIRRLGRALATSPMCLPLVPAHRFGLTAVQQLADEVTQARAPRRRAGALA